MQHFILNGHAVNILIMLMAERRGERSRTLGRWVAEPAYEDLYRYDPKARGVALDFPIKVDFSEDTVARLREALAEQMMEIERWKSMAAIDDEQGAMAFLSQSTGAFAEILFLADVFGVSISGELPAP